MAAGASGRPPAAADDTGCTILHVDMDAFYASVEIRDRPELAGRPVIVGHATGRSVVLSATYEARAAGVRSAMPMARARRLCPQAVVIAPRHGLYGAVSREVMAIFRGVTPAVEPLSLDEAFLDVAGARRRLGTPTRIGQLIRQQVADQQGITCSVGIAVNKFLAKLASVHCKPDGLLVVPAAGTLDFLHPLPVSALWGVGERTCQALTRLGLRTVGTGAVPEEWRAVADDVAQVGGDAGVAMLFGLVPAHLGDGRGRGVLVAMSSAELIVLAESDGAVAPTGGGPQALVVPRRTLQQAREGGDRLLLRSAGVDRVLRLGPRLAAAAAELIDCAGPARSVIRSAG